MNAKKYCVLLLCIFALQSYTGQSDRQTIAESYAKDRQITAKLYSKNYNPDKDMDVFWRLVHVSFSRSGDIRALALMSKANRQKRIDDLCQLYALIINRYISLVNGAGLKQQAHTENLKVLISKELAAAAGKKELIDAARFPSLFFEAVFEDELESIFQQKIAFIDLKAGSKQKYQELRKLLKEYQVKIANNKQPFTFLTFENITTTDMLKIKNEQQKNKLQALINAVYPDTKQKIEALNKATRRLNNYITRIKLALFDLKSAEENKIRYIEEIK